MSKDPSPTMHDPVTQSQGDYGYRAALGRLDKAYTDQLAQERAGK